jgi:hypothetical protein
LPRRRSAKLRQRRDDLGAAGRVPRRYLDRIAGVAFGSSTAKPAETDLLCRVPPLRLERADDLGGHLVRVKRQSWRNDGPTAGRHAGCPGAGRPDRVESSPPTLPLQAALASVGRSNDLRLGGSSRIALARGCRAGADHKFLIVPQCTLSAGIGLCGICAKSEQLAAIPLVFPVLPQLRHIAAINAIGSLAMRSRTGTARSTTNTREREGTLQPRRRSEVVPSPRDPEGPC